MKATTDKPVKRLSRAKTLKLRVEKAKERKGIRLVQLAGFATGYYQFPPSKTMRPEMMRRLLGGKFPDTGFSWDCVYEFRYEDGAWHPYDEFGEILPAVSFEAKATVLEGSF